MSRNGFTLTELLFALALGMALIAVSVPAFGEILVRVRHNTAVRQVLSDVREARSQAISMGWQFQVVGYDDDATSSRKNQYRILGRRSTAVAWPDENAAPFSSDSQRAGRWVDLGSDYPGVTIDTNDDRFELTFDSRGTSSNATLNFAPMRVKNEDDLEARITVSVVGGVKVE